MNNNLNNNMNNNLNDFDDDSLKKTFKNKRLPLATRQETSLDFSLIRAQFDVVLKPVALPKISDFTTVKIKGVFYIAAIILSLVKNFNLNSNLAVAIFGNTTVILTIKAEM